MIRNQRNWLTDVAYGCAAIVSCNICAAALAQVESGSATVWLDAKQLEKARLLPVSASWTQSPIGSQLNLFAKQRQRAIFLDRRVDSTTQQTLQLVDQTTEQVIWKVANANGLGVARVGDLLYVGPKESADRLAFVIEELKQRIKKLPKTARSKWNRNSAIRWPAATTTTQIDQWLTQEHDLQLNAPLPHDVWPEADWPELSLVEQVSLILVGFDRTFQIAPDGTSLSVVRFPVLESAVSRFSLPSKTFDLKEVKTKFPDLKFSRSGKSYTARGTPGLISQLESWLVAQQTAEVKDGERKFDLNTTARRGDILATVASQTGRKLELDQQSLDENVMEILNGRVTLDLSKVSLSTLLDTCLEGTGVSYQISDGKLTLLKR